jgi:hypothetical protein
VAIIGATLALLAIYVSAGICAANGERVTFSRVMRYGVPTTVAQLALGAVYVLGLVAVSRWE